MALTLTPKARKIVNHAYFSCLWPNAHHMTEEKASTKLELLRNLIQQIREAPTREEKAYWGLSIPEIQEAIRRTEVHLAAGGSTRSGLEKKAAIYAEAVKLHERRLAANSLHARGIKAAANTK